MVGLQSARYLLATASALALLALTTTAHAEPWDTGAVVDSYAAALNAHDLDAGLALFDEYGSATDIRGHNFQGSDELTSFLLASGFGQPDAQITTLRLLVVANRAIWTYSCSCSDTPIDVRMVLANDHKISVFAIMPPAAQTTQNAGDTVPWPIVLAAASLIFAAGSWVYRCRQPRLDSLPRPAQGGRLLAALASTRRRTWLS
jgi:hypothetical protein